MLLRWPSRLKMSSAFLRVCVSDTSDRCHLTNSRVLPVIALSMKHLPLGRGFLTCSGTGACLCLAATHPIGWEFRDVTHTSMSHTRSFTANTRA